MRRGVIPGSGGGGGSSAAQWDWRRFLKAAAKLLGYAFEKSDAQVGGVSGGC